MPTYTLYMYTLALITSRYTVDQRVFKIHSHTDYVCRYTRVFSIELKTNLNCVINMLLNCTRYVLNMQFFTSLCPVREFIKIIIIKLIIIIAPVRIPVRMCTKWRTLWYNYRCTINNIIRLDWYLMYTDGLGSYIRIYMSWRGRFVYMQL